MPACPQVIAAILQHCSSCRRIGFRYIWKPVPGDFQFALQPKAVSVQACSGAKGIGVVDGKYTWRRPDSIQTDWPIPNGHQFGRAIRDLLLSSTRRCVLAICCLCCGRRYRPVDALPHFCHQAGSHIELVAATRNAGVHHDCRMACKHLHCKSIR